ncbi:MAG: hypothetical protein IJ094_01165 [Bacilli bacterium]|nr:hypothetical protein [Bacilli bacterium]
MSTLVRILIFSAEFLIFFLYGFFWTRRSYLKIKNNEQIFSSIQREEEAKNNLRANIKSYCIIYIAFIAAYIFLFPGHVFLSINKMIILACIIVSVILYQLFNYFVFEKDYEIIPFLLLIPFILMVVVISLQLIFPYDFSTTIHVSDEQVYEITDVNYCIKYPSDSKFNGYYVRYIENGEKMEGQIPEDHVISFEEGNTHIRKHVTLYTKINYELKDAKEYIESDNKYEVTLPKNFVTELP